MRILSLALCLFLCACGTQIVYKPVPVDVAVPVPCKIAPVASPAWPTDSVGPDASMFEKARAALAELILRRGYEAQLEAATKSCS